MTISSKITRFNMHQLPPYERMQHMRARRQAALEEQQKSMNFANGMANVLNNQRIEQGNLISRIVMTRLSKKA